jgi:hypothetical protein
MPVKMALYSNFEPEIENSFVIYIALNKEKFYYLSQKPPFLRIASVVSIMDEESIILYRKARQVMDEGNLEDAIVLFE